MAKKKLKKKKNSSKKKLEVNKINAEAKLKVKEVINKKNDKKNEKKSETKENFNFLLKKSINNITALIFILIFAGILVFMKMNVIENIVSEKNTDLSYMFPERKELIYNGTDFVTKCYPIFREVIFLGDSYTLLLGNELCGDLICYAESGHMVGELVNACNEAIKSRGKYVSIFIGPNDMRYNVNIEKFKSDLKVLVDKTKEAGKEVIISSYLKSEYTELMNQEYKNSKTVDDYDNAIQEVCKEENVYYLDVKDINDYHTDKMLLDGVKRDILHFNETFYIKYMNKLYSFLYDIEKRKFDPRKR